MQKCRIDCPVCKTAFSVTKIDNKSPAEPENLQLYCQHCNITKSILSSACKDCYKNMKLKVENDEPKKLFWHCKSCNASLRLTNPQRFDLVKIAQSKKRQKPKLDSNEKAGASSISDFFDGLEGLITLASSVWIVLTILDSFKQSDMSELSFIILLVVELGLVFMTISIIFNVTIDKLRSKNSKRSELRFMSVVALIMLSLTIKGGEVAEKNKVIESGLVGIYLHSLVAIVDLPHRGAISLINSDKAMFVAGFYDLLMIPEIMLAKYQSSPRPSQKALASHAKLRAKEAAKLARQGRHEEAIEAYANAAASASTANDYQQLKAIIEQQLKLNGAR